MKVFQTLCAIIHHRQTDSKNIHFFRQETQKSFNVMGLNSILKCFYLICLCFFVLFSLRCNFARKVETIFVLFFFCLFFGDDKIFGFILSYLVSSFLSWTHFWALLKMTNIKKEVNKRKYIKVRKNSLGNFASQNSQKPNMCCC